MTKIKGYKKPNEIHLLLQKCYILSPCHVKYVMQSYNIQDEPTLPYCVGRTHIILQRIQNEIKMNQKSNHRIGKQNTLDLKPYKKLIFRLYHWILSMHPPPPPAKKNPSVNTSKGQADWHRTVSTVLNWIPRQIWLRRKALLYLGTNSRKAITYQIPLALTTASALIQTSSLIPAWNQQGSTPKCSQRCASESEIHIHC